VAAVEGALHLVERRLQFLNNLRRDHHHIHQPILLSAGCWHPPVEGDATKDIRWKYITWIGSGGSKAYWFFASHIAVIGLSERFARS
jgi:hypothetical protein